MFKSVRYKLSSEREGDSRGLYEDWDNKQLLFKLDAYIDLYICDIKFDSDIKRPPRRHPSV